MDFEAIKKAAQAYSPDMTRFLRDMIAECQAQGLMQKVRNRVVGFNRRAAFGVHAQFNTFTGIHNAFGDLADMNP